LSIWSGLRESLNARGITPSTGGRCNIGGGVGIARTGFCGPIGALNSCAAAVLASTAAIAIRNVFIFFPFVRGVQILARRHALPTLYTSMDYLEKAGRVLDIEIFELKRLRDRLGQDFSRAVELIKDTVDARGKVVVVGVGKSGHIGAKIAATLTSTGSPAVVLDSSNALHGDLGVIADGDVVLALSASGETEELLRILPAIARFQVRIIAMCSDPKSTLAENAHLFLDVNIEQEACPLNLAPTSSTTVMLALGDALAMVLLEARGFNKEGFAKLHPGGMIGRSMLTRVYQIMRPRQAMAVVSTNASVRDVLKAMTSVRAGAAVVIGEDEELLGIFTHGDFVRHFQSDPRIGERLVADLMTLNPVTVHKDKLAVEVLNLLERHRIDDLVVIDDDNVPVGIVDSQDLTRLKLL
jgi:arabinose-5-phosphate isomerase